MAQPTDAAECQEQDGLTLQMRQAIEWLASGLTDAEAAEKVDVHPTSISRWRRTVSAFVPAERRAEDEAVARTRRRLRTLTYRAVQTLEEVLDGTVTRTDDDGNPYEVKADPQHRIAAAKTILDRAGVGEVKGVELTGANGGPVAVDIEHARSLFRAALELTPEQRAAVRAADDPS